MHRYEELERIYYKKLFLKWFVFIFILVGIVFVFLFFKESKTKVVTNSKAKTIKKEKTTTAVEKNISVAKKVVVKKVEINESKSTQKIVKKDIQITPPKITFVLPQIKENEQEVKKEVKKEIKNHFQEVKTKLTSKNVDIKTLIQKFNQTKSYDVAITISKYYLNKNRLKQSQIWALNANSINPQKPESWLIFADILIKKGDRQRAKKILQIYVDTYGNNDIIEEKLRSLDGK